MSKMKNSGAHKPRIIWPGCDLSAGESQGEGERCKAQQVRRGSWGRQTLTDHSVELMQDVDGLRRKRRNSSQRRVKKLTVYSFKNSE